MLVIRQYRIYREDIIANRQLVYIFGDNLERKGYGGQAEEMRGEPNSFGIAMKRRPMSKTNSCYFFDAQLDVQKIIDDEFERLYEHISENDYHGIVVPTEGIGTGLSKMTEYAPISLKRINFLLEELRYL